MKNVIVRSLSGIIYIALIVGAIFYGSQTFYLLTTLFAIVGVYEFIKVSGAGEEDNRFPAIDCLFAAFITYSIQLQQTLMAPLLPLALYMLVKLTIALADKSGAAFRHTAKGVLAVMYVALPMYMLNLLYSSGPYNHQLVLLMFVMIWLNDTGAYCFGSTLGRNKLCERLSPKKSWEGFFGGMLCCVLMGWACYAWFNSIDYSLWEWLVYGALVSLLSTWGDLFESLVKRTYKVKDSGNIIPGHGGILDRIDSLLFVAPATFIFYWITL